MTYQLKNGEEIRNGKLYGWTGNDCPNCKGTGEDYSDQNYRTCGHCAGTGEEWGLISIQPDNLSEATK